MRILIILWTLLLSPVAATEHLNAICNGIIKEGIIKAHFTQLKTICGLPKPLESQGDMVLWNGKGILWKTNTPFPSTLLLSQKGIFQVDGTHKRPLMKGQKQDQYVMTLLSKVLSGSFADINEFQVDVLSPLGAKEWQIRLTPSGGLAKVIATIIIKGEKFIHHIAISRTNGDRDEITLKDHHIDSNPIDLGTLLDE